MSVLILGNCPRDNCKGSIMADGTCFLCARSVGEPVAEPKPPDKRQQHFEDWSVKCNARDHMACGGRRWQRGFREGTFALCMCPCHSTPLETKPRLAGTRMPKILPVFRGGDWVTLKYTGPKHVAHLLLDRSLVGVPPIYNSTACGRWFPMLDLRAATKNVPQCKRCIKTQEKGGGINAPC